MPPVAQGTNTATIALDERYRVGVAPHLDGVAVSFFSGPHCTKEEFLERAGDATIIAVWQPSPFRFDKDVLGELSRLEYIHKSGVGFDAFDLDALNELGILLSVNRGANASSVAEHALLLTLMVLRGGLKPFDAVREGVWLEKEEPHLSYELRGKTVGIVGMGSIGAHLAKRLQGFDVELLMFRRSPLEELAIVTSGSWVPLDDLLRNSDVVVLALPLSGETRHLIGEREFGLMKESAVLVNVARGGVVDEGALGRALTTGRLLGAGLDVLSAEPPSRDHPLVGLDNVVITPHRGGPSQEGWNVQRQRTLRNIQRFLDGEPPMGLVNGELLETPHYRASQRFVVTG